LHLLSAAYLLSRQGFDFDRSWHGGNLFVGLSTAKQAQKHACTHYFCDLHSFSSLFFLIAHFWGPIANWGFVVAGLADMQKEPNIISAPMTSGMCLVLLNASCADFHCSALRVFCVVYAVCLDGEAEKLPASCMPCLQRSGSVDTAWQEDQVRNGKVRTIGFKLSDCIALTLYG
jgi:hypothetical protein